MFIVFQSILILKVFPINLPVSSRTLHQMALQSALEWSFLLIGSLMHWNCNVILNGFFDQNEKNIKTFFSSEWWIFTVLKRQIYKQILSINGWKLLTLAGYRNSFTNPKSSPVANTLLSLVRHEAVTSVTSPIIGQIPSQQEPKTLVHDAQPIFSTYKTAHLRQRILLRHFSSIFNFEKKILALKDTSHLKDSILIHKSLIFLPFKISFESCNFTAMKFKFQNLNKCFENFYLSCPFRLKKTNYVFQHGLSIPRKI